MRLIADSPLPAPKETSVIEPVASARSSLQPGFPFLSLKSSARRNDAEAGREALRLRRPQLLSSFQTHLARRLSRSAIWRSSACSIEPSLLIGCRITQTGRTIMCFAKMSRVYSIRYPIRLTVMPRTKQRTSELSRSGHCPRWPHLSGQWVPRHTRDMLARLPFSTR